MKVDIEDEEWMRKRVIEKLPSSFYAKTFPKPNEYCKKIARDGKKGAGRDVYRGKR